jgi:group I intron endonuclease
MHYTIYKVTNQINGKVYIGCHKTLDLNDGYMGSGKYLKRAMEKHGLENFTKEILHDFGTPEEMFLKESELVTLDFISEENTYNLKVGGFGGFDYINKTITKEQILVRSQNGYSKSKLHMTDPIKNRKTGLKLYELGLGIHNPKNSFLGRKHTEETKKKIGLTNSIHQRGVNNSNYGKMWICCDETRENKCIPKTSEVPKGWRKGRKSYGM